MTTANYITRTELREELQEALKPVIDRLDGVDKRLDGVDKRLDRIEGDLKHVRGRTNQIYDALQKHGLPMAKEGDDG